MANNQLFGSALLAFDRRRLRELLRFTLTGILCLFVNVTGMALFTERVGLHYLTALALSSSISATVGFGINRRWTFRVYGTLVAPEYLRYVITAGAQILVSLWSCEWLVNGLHVRYLAAVIVISGILAPLSYLAHRAWSFGLAWLQQRA